MRRHPRMVASVLVAIAALLVGTMQPAEAEFRLSLNDILVATDGQSGDSNGTKGVILFNGTVGNFIVSIQVASSKPLVGSATDPVLMLNSTNLFSISAGTLTIKVSDTDFGPVVAPAAFATAINGTSVPGKIAATAYFENGNVDFTTANVIGYVAPVGPGNNIGGVDIGSSFSPTTPFSLDLEAKVTATAYGQTVQFDANLTKVSVPEPSASLCLGMALFGLAGYGWWGRKKNNDPTQG